MTDADSNDDHFYETRLIPLPSGPEEVSLEAYFWECLEEIQAEEGVDLAALLFRVGHLRRPDQEWYKAIRVWILEYYRSKRPS